MALHPQLDQLINAMLPLVQQCHAEGELAPHAASMSASGEMTGEAFVVKDETAVERSGSVREALAYFEGKFRKAAQANEIVASAIFFHGVGLAEPARPAQTAEEASALVALLEHRVGESVFLVIPYRVAEVGIQYELGKLVAKPAAVFSPKQPKAKPWWRVW
jgi:hypothetical protein